MSIVINQVTPVNKITNINKANRISFSGETNSRSSQKDKNKLSAALLTILAIGIGVWGYFKLKKRDSVLNNVQAKQLSDSQNLLKNIFNKDFTIDETSLIVQRYQNLVKTADNKEFCNKLFEQLKKDFQVENKNLKFVQWETPLSFNDGKMYGYTEALTREIAAVIQEDKIKTIGTIFHEFKHVKQNELMYKTDSARLVEAKVKELEKSNNASWQEILRNSGGNKEKARKTVQKEVEKTYREIWGHLKPVSKTSPEYRQGLKYLENEENRIPAGANYYNQILEKEAKFAGENAEKLFKLIIK